MSRVRRFLRLCSRYPEANLGDLWRLAGRLP